jgi:hypothetical protein
MLEEIVSGTLESFDGAENLNARVTVAAASGVPVDCPAPKKVAERMKMAQFIFCK